jgi:hypothetical protein
MKKQSLRVQQLLMGETTPLASSRQSRPTQWLTKTALLHQNPKLRHQSPLNLVVTSL